MYWRFALLVLLIASVPQAKADPPDDAALRLLNHYRQIAGLAPVKLDRQLSAGCMEHANYMVQNQGTDAMAGLNTHSQRPNLPGGERCGCGTCQGGRRNPDDRHLRQYTKSGPTLISIQVWSDPASAENAFRDGLVTWENDAHPPEAAVVY